MTHGILRRFLPVRLSGDSKASYRMPRRHRDKYIVSRIPFLLGREVIGTFRWGNRCYGILRGETAVVALLVVDNDGAICMGNKKECRRRGNPVYGRAG